MSGLALLAPSFASAAKYGVSNNGKIVRVTAISDKDDPAQEFVEVSLDAGQVRIHPHTLRFYTLPSNCQRPVTVITCTVTDLQRVIVKTGPGDDVVHVDDPSITVPTSIVTGNGNDEVLGGAGPDLINTGNGNDGVDNPESVLNVTDEVDGRGGNDKIVLGAGDLDPTDPDPDDGEEPAFFQRATGGLGNDLVSGKSFGDVLSGDDGNDTLKSSYGSDQLSGGSGDDKLLSGSGNDVLTGGPGVDMFNASSGDDTVDSNDGQADLNITCGSGLDDLLADPFDNSVIKPGCENQL